MGNRRRAFRGRGISLHARNGLNGNLQPAGPGSPPHWTLVFDPDACCFTRTFVVGNGIGPTNLAPLFLEINFDRNTNGIAGRCVGRERLGQRPVRE